jgi:NAD-dependent dihydropyrimidine dehydrogenase PreA subunit
MNIVYIVGAIILFWLFGGICRRLHNRNNVIHVIENNCTGCKYCLKKCFHKVLEIVSDENGRHVIVKYPDKCTACGDCMCACKFNALEVVKQK